jgi:hypothetical protein
MAAMKQLAADLLPKRLKKPPKSDGSQSKLPKKRAVSVSAPPMADELFGMKCRWPRA